MSCSIYKGISNMVHFIDFMVVLSHFYCDRCQPKSIAKMLRRGFIYSRQYTFWKRATLTGNCDLIGLLKYGKSVDIVESP